MLGCVLFFSIIAFAVYSCIKYKKILRLKSILQKNQRSNNSNIQENNSVIVANNILPNEQPRTDQINLNNYIKARKNCHDISDVPANYIKPTEQMSQGDSLMTNSLFLNAELTDIFNEEYNASARLSKTANSNQNQFDCSNWKQEKTIHSENESTLQVCFKNMTPLKNGFLRNKMTMINKDLYKL